MDIGGIRLESSISFGNLLTVITMVVAAFKVKSDIEKSQAVIIERHNSLEKRLEESSESLERRLADQVARSQDHENRDTAMFANIQTQMTVINGNVQRVIGQFEGAQAAQKTLGGK